MKTKHIHKSKESIENSWIKLESIFDITPVKSSRKLQPYHKKSANSVNIRRTYNRSIGKSPKDSPEPSIIRSGTPSLPCSKPIISIDGLTNPQLKLLYHAKCEDLHIPVLPDQQFRFFSFCAKHFNKRKFEMKESGLGDFSATVIGEILTENIFFAYILLGQNMLGDLGALRLCKLIQRNTCIVHLDISSNNITPDGAEEILKALSLHHSIVSLDISSHEGLHRNRLGSNGASGLNYLLSRNIVIAYINVAGTSIGEGVENIFSGLEKKSNLVAMNLANNAIGGECMKNLMLALRKIWLIELDISLNCIGNDGCEGIASFLMTNPALEKLELSSNGISTKGARKIFDGLSNNSHLKILNFENNPMQNGPSEEIEYFLSTNNTIEHLNLSKCMLKNEGVLLLAEGLAKNKSLEHLKLNLNSIGDSGVEGIAIAISRNNTLKSIDLANNRIKNPGALFIANGLRSNSSIQDVNLKENAIKDAGGAAIEEVTRTNSNLIRLCLDFNQVNSRCLANIKEHLKNNFEKFQKNLPLKIKRQTENIHYDENAIHQVMQKVQQKKKEKDELKQRNDKNVEKLTEIKNTEEEKLNGLKDTLNGLKIRNSELSNTLEQLQSILLKSRLGFDRQVNEISEKTALVEIEIKKYEKKSNF